MSSKRRSTRSEQGKRRSRTSPDKGQSNSGSDSPKPRSTESQASHSGTLEQFQEFWRTHGLWITGILLLVYLLSFVSRPLPDLTVIGDAESKVFRWTVLEITSGSGPAQYADAYFKGGVTVNALIDRGLVLAMALLFSGVAWGLGRLLIVGLSACNMFGKLELHGLAIAIGWQIHSLLLLLVGVLGGLTRVGILIGYAITFAALFVLVFLQKRKRSKSACEVAPDRESELDEAHIQEQLSPSASNSDHYSTVLRRLCLFASFGLGIFLISGAMLPPVDFDVLEYHLQIPKEWFQEGRIGFVEHNVYGNMPLGAELHSTAAMAFSPRQPDWWWGAIVGKTIMGLYACVTAMLLYVAGKRLLNATAGAVASFLFLSIPWVMKTGFLGWNENAFALNLVASTLLVLSVLRDGHSFGRSDAWVRVALSGFLAGAAVSTKYPGVLFVVLPLALLIGTFGLWRSRIGWHATGTQGNREPSSPDVNSHSSALILVGVFLVAATISCGPWFAKNAVFAGNPTYPLLSDLWRVRTPEQNQQWRDAHRVTDDGAFGPSRLLSDMDSALIGSQWLSPLLIPCVVFSVMLPRQRSNVLFLLAFFAFGLFVWWLLTHRIERFIVPLYPLLALLGGIGVAGQVEAPWRFVVASFLIVGSAINLAMIVSPVPLLTSEARILAEYEVLVEPKTPLSLVHHQINELVQDGDRVLLVGDAIPFDLEVGVLYNTCFDDCRLELLTKGKSPREQLESLQQARVTYVFVYWQELERYRAPGSYGYSDYVSQEVVGKLMSDGVIVPEPTEMSPNSGQLFRVATTIE